MTTYTHTTLAAAAAQLALRLSDPLSRFYTQPEQYSAIREALRLWNVTTSQNRERGFIRTTSAVSFYDLSTTLTTSPGSGTLLRPYTITDAQIISEMNAHLLESVQATDMFTSAQILSALTNARDQFLADSYTVLVRRSDAVAPGSGTLDYPDTVIGIRRAVYRSYDNRYTQLLPSDERTATAFNRDWQTTGVPRSYSIASSRPLRIRIIPPPSDLGTIESIVIASGAALTGSGVPLGVPDDLAWGVKYGALAALFAADGPAADPPRAERANAMYRLAVAIAQKIPSILHAEIDSRPVIPSSVFRVDRFRSGWEGKTQSRPDTVALIGPDLIAAIPPPDSAPHTIALDVVRAAPIPQLTTDYLQIGRERLSALLDFAQWICLLKVGGDELSAAEPLFTHFLTEATTFSHQRSALSSAITIMNETGILPLVEDAAEIDPSAGVRNADEIREERNARRRRPAAT